MTYPIRFHHICNLILVVFLALAVVQCTKPDPVEPAPEVPEQPGGQPDPENPEQPDPENPEQPDPETPDQPDPENPDQPDPENPDQPDPENPDQPDQPVGRAFELQVPDGVTVIHKKAAGESVVPSGGEIYEGETVTFRADGLSDGWEVSAWALWEHKELKKKYDSSASTEWNYTVSAEDAYYDGTIRISFIEKSRTAPVTVYTYGEDSISGIESDGLPYMPLPDEFADYWYDDVCDINRYTDYLLCEETFPPYSEKFVDVLSLFGNAPDLRLYYLGPYNDYMNPGKQVHLIGDQQVDTDVFSFALKADPADGKTKLYLKDRLDNSDTKMVDPLICAIQGNRWFIIVLKLMSQDQMDSQARQKEVDDYITQLIASPEFASLTSEYDKVKKVHDYLADSITYGKEEGYRYFAQMAYGALIRKICVCEGYSRAFKAIIDRMGMNSTVVIGNNGFHAWNTVQVDGVWYHIDVTWDDLDGWQGIQHRYDYFLKSDTYMREHSHSFVTLHECPKDYGQ